MDTPAGLTFADPSVVVGQLPVEAGQKVADFGCGSGYFSFEFAKRVGAEGMVYALDVLPAALEAVASRAKTLGLTNIIAKRVNLERERGSGLPDAGIDWVVLKDMLFQNQDKSVIIREMARVLKPGGHAILMEWSPTEVMVGPDKELRVTPDQMKALVEEAGLALEREISVGGFHYAFLVKH